jgi:hypothetical protein
MHEETGYPQDLTKLRTFGCPAMIYIRVSTRNPHPKLAPRSQHGIFIGMSSVGNGRNFLIDKARTFQSIQFVDFLDFKFNDAMTGPCSTTMHRGQFFSHPLETDSPTPIHTIDHHQEDSNDIVHTSMSDLHQSTTPSVTLVMQPQLPIPHISLSPQRYTIRRLFPVTPVAPPPTSVRSQRRRALTPRFDIDAPNQRAQLEFNQRTCPCFQSPPPYSPTMPTLRFYRPRCPHIRKLILHL